MSDLAETLIRNIDDAASRPLDRPPNYGGTITRLTPGTLARKLGASCYTLEPGKKICPYHLHHAQEELFFIIEGSGTLRVAGEELPVRQGDTIFIPPGPEYPHQLINSSDKPLRYLSISTMEDPEICEYPDSGKFLAEGSLNSETPFEVIDRRGEGRGYWDGEA